MTGEAPARALLPRDLVDECRRQIAHLLEQGLIEEGSAPLATSWCVIISGVDATRFVQALEVGGTHGIDRVPPTETAPAMPLETFFGEPWLGLLCGFPCTYRRHVPPGQMAMARIEWLEEMDDSLSEATAGSSS